MEAPRRHRRNPRREDGSLGRKDNVERENPRVSEGSRVRLQKIQFERVPLFNVPQSDKFGHSWHGWANLCDSQDRRVSDTCYYLEPLVSF